MAQNPEEARMRFAANVERVCRQHDYSMDQLVERSGIEREELETIMRGETEVRVDSILRLAGALEVTPADFYEGVAWIPDGEGGGEFQIDELPGD
jgi:transcriptional regulator with XRE-family HTH domain